MHRQFLKFRLNVFGIFLSIAPLLGHLMSGLRTKAIPGTQLRKIFEIVVFDTLNLYAKSVLHRPNLNFINITNRWSSSVSFWIILSKLPVIFVTSHSKSTEVSPVREKKQLSNVALNSCVGTCRFLQLLFQLYIFCL